MHPMGDRSENYAPKGALGLKDLSVKNPFVVRKKYRMAREAVDGRLGAECTRAESWRAAWLFTMALLGGAIAGTVYLGAQPRLVPHIIERNSETGQYRYLGRIGTSLQNPSPSDVDAQVRLYIRLTRSVSSDRYVNRANWRQAMRMSTEGQRKVLKRWGAEFKPQHRAKAGEVRRAEVRWAQPLSKNTWQVEWVERVRKGGQLIAEKPWRANITLEKRKPKEEKDLVDCPTGLYVAEVHWNEYLTDKNEKVDG